MKSNLRPFLLFALVIWAVVARAQTLADTLPSSPVLKLYEHVLAGAREHPPRPGDIICIGSSHMQRWQSMAADLAPLTAHNYGIGGSRMTEAADLFIDNLAIAFKPRAVILYEGSNDIAEGATPDAVLANFKRIHRKLHAALPETRLYVLSIVPSPGKRFEKIGEIRRANELMRQECVTQVWMRFIDITSPLIGSDGQPRPECFIPGDIHMLPAGYAVWKSAIASVCIAVEEPFERQGPMAVLSNPGKR